MESFSHFPRQYLLVLCLGLLISGCTPRQLIVGNIADELAGQSQSSESDLDLAREASAFYLKLSESILQQDPKHLRLAESVAAGFTQYAYAFVAFEADQTEAMNVKRAERLRLRAARLYRRAHHHAMLALETSNPGFSAQLNSTSPQHWPAIPDKQVGLAYWAAASWGGMISLSKDDPDVVADLPLAIRLAQQAWQANPNWGDGALTGLLGTFEAARPGGSRPQALAYFEQSLAQADGRSAGAYVSQAEGYALPGGDRSQFEQLLRQALAVKDTPGSSFTLQNEVMRRRATWLLEKSDDLF